MKANKLAAIILIIGFAAVILWGFAGCSTPPTPEQIKAYSDATHSVIGNGLQDYKAVKRATKE